MKVIGWLCVILPLWARALDAADAASFASLTLEWNPNPETDIAGYIVYWGTESGVYPDSVDVGDQTSWRVSGLVDQIRYYFVVRAYDTEDLVSPPSAEVSGRTSGPLPAVVGDFTGQRKADLAVFRPSLGVWYVLQPSSLAFDVIQWGLNGDVPVPGDYDGDGKADIAVYRPSNGGWYILQSSTSYTTYRSYGGGLAGDKPVPGDYDGDGKADIAMYRPSNGGWYILQSSTNYATYVSYQWGLGGDVPVPADYDGDGKTDIAVYRPSSGGWFILQSSTNYATYVSYVWGLVGDMPLLARN